MDETNDSGTTAEASAGTPATTAAAPAAAEGTAGIVAIDSNEHAEAKTLFQRLRDSVEQGVEDLEADFDKLKALLHL